MKPPNSVLVLPAFIFVSIAQLPALGSNRRSLRKRLLGGQLQPGVHVEALHLRDLDAALA